MTKMKMTQRFKMNCDIRSPPIKVLSKLTYDLLLLFILNALLQSGGL